MSIKEEIFNNYYEELTFDDPIDYKGLLLYPVSVKKIIKINGKLRTMSTTKPTTADKYLILT